MPKAIIPRGDVYRAKASANGDGHSADHGYVAPADAPLGGGGEQATLAARLALLAQDAHERHKNDTTTLSPGRAPAAPLTPAKDTPPAPDFLTHLRATGKLLAFLDQDTPERRALLTAAGVDPDSYNPRSVVKAGRGILAEVDQMHADNKSLWAKFPGLCNDLQEPTVQPLGLRTRRLSEVVERPVEWLWPQRIPVGYLSLVSGDPDLGKTWLLLDIIARVTTGRGFPDGAPNPSTAPDPAHDPLHDPAIVGTLNRRDALWVSAEDADEDVVKPRLRMLGADDSRVHSLRFVRDREETARGSGRFQLRERTLDLGRHLEQLDNWLANHPLVAVVVLDPLAAFVGKTDTHRNSDVRGLLTPLTKLADRHRVAVIGNNHLHKGDGDNAMYRGMGSLAFVAAARSSWLVTRDPKGPADQRLFTNVKKNLASEDVGGLAFRVGPACGGFLWGEGKVTTTADEALRAPDRDAKAPARAEAREWLRELLTGGPVPAAEVWEKAKADSMCEKTVKAAKRELGVRTEKTGGSGAGWAWSLPAGPPG